MINEKLKELTEAFLKALNIIGEIKIKEEANDVGVYSNSRLVGIWFKNDFYVVRETITKGITQVIKTADILSGTEKDFVAFKTISYSINFKIN